MNNLRYNRQLIRNAFRSDVKSISDQPVMRAAMYRNRVTECDHSMINDTEYLFIEKLSNHDFVVNSAWKLF